MGSGTIVRFVVGRVPIILTGKPEHQKPQIFNSFGA